MENLRPLKVIAVAGAGGKTTLCRLLADRYCSREYKVLLTTTTHMLTEPETELSCDSTRICERLEKDGFCMAGSPCEGEPAKFTALPDELYLRVCSDVDFVIVEADGSKHLPAKYPRDDEPVLPANATECIVVMGLDAIGRSVGDAVQRWELVPSYWHLDPRAPVTFDLLFRLADEGYRAKLKIKYPGLPVSLLFSRWRDGRPEYLCEEEAKEIYGA